jgi:hypothetical protein
MHTRSAFCDFLWDRGTEVCAEWYVNDVQCVGQIVTGIL